MKNLPRNNEAYTKLANEYEKKLNYSAKEYLLKNAIGQHIKSGSKIAVIGAGTGYDIKLINELKKNCTIIGIEPNKKLFQKSKNLFEKIRKNKIFLYNIKAEEFGNKFRNFDCVLFSYSLHEVLDKRKGKKTLLDIIKRFKNKLKSKGILIIIDFEYCEECDEKKLNRWKNKIVKDLGHWHEKREIFYRREILKTSSKYFKKIHEYNLKKAKYRISNEYSLVLKKL